MAKRRRANGEGTLRQRNDGRWECTVMVGFRDNGQRKYRSFYGQTQKEDWEDFIPEHAVSKKLEEILKEKSIRKKEHEEAPVN